MSDDETRGLTRGEWLGLAAVGCGAFALLTLFPLLAISLRDALSRADALTQTTFLQRALVSPVACVIGGIVAVAFFVLAARKRYPFVMRRVLATTSLLIVFIFAMTFRSAANIATREGARGDDHATSR
ncbi:MAG: hypothetical protein IPK60_13940 [Sandaracinaceae bacterium]|jgi:tellurite resistance protein TehA-like permease|nr:hypothetical protein [Sandaracinaceae bacterium]